MQFNLYQYTLLSSIPLVMMNNVFADVTIGPNTTRSTTVTQSTANSTTTILDNVAINVSGNSHGIYLTRGNVVFDGSNITISTNSSTYNQGYGIYINPTAGGPVFLTNLGANPSISTTGASSHAIGASGVNADATPLLSISGINLTTNGDAASGIVFFAGAVGKVQNAIIATHGNRYGATIIGAYGANTQAGSTLELSDSIITTYGTNGTALYNEGNLTVDGLTISTEGDIQGYGINTQTLGNTTVTRTKIKTQGNTSIGVRVSGDSALATLNGSGVDIATSGVSGSGVVTRFNAIANIDNFNINTQGSAAYGLYSYRLNSRLNANYTTIATAGASGFGVVAYGLGQKTPLVLRHFSLLRLCRKRL